MPANDAEEDRGPVELVQLLSRRSRSRPHRRTPLSLRIPTTWASHSPRTDETAAADSLVVAFGRTFTAERIKTLVRYNCSLDKEKESFKLAQQNGKLHALFLPILPNN